MDYDEFAAVSVLSTEIDGGIETAISPLADLVAGFLRERARRNLSGLNIIPGGVYGRDEHTSIYGRMYGFVSDRLYVRRHHRKERRGARAAPECDDWIYWSRRLGQLPRFIPGPIWSHVVGGAAAHGVKTPQEFGKDAIEWGSI